MKSSLDKHTTSCGWCLFSRKSNKMKAKYLYRLYWFSRIKTLNSYCYTSASGYVARTLQKCKRVHVHFPKVVCFWRIRHGFVIKSKEFAQLRLRVLVRNPSSLLRILCLRRDICEFKQPLICVKRLFGSGMNIMDIEDWFSWCQLNLDRGIINWLFDLLGTWFAIIYLFLNWQIL